MGAKSDFIRGFHSLERWKITHCTDKIWWGKWQRKGKQFLFAVISKYLKTMIEACRSQVCICLRRKDRDPWNFRPLPLIHQMSQWTSPYLPTSSWYYWSPWYSTQSLSSTIPIKIHVNSIFAQLLSDENVISFYKSSQNYNHPKCSDPGNSHTAPGTEPSVAQRQACSIICLRDGWRDVDCIINNFYYYFIFILLLLWAILD